MGILEERRYQPRLDRGSRGLRRSVWVRVSGSDSVSVARSAWATRVSGPWPASRLPHNAHELAHAHAHANREPACWATRKFPNKLQLVP